MGVTTFHKKDYGVLDKHHVTPAYFYTLKFYAAECWPGPYVLFDFTTRCGAGNQALFVTGREL